MIVDSFDNLVEARRADMFKNLILNLLKPERLI
jgi:hypothetical protein